MVKMISKCGLECTACPAFIAYKTNDNELRIKAAREWSKEYNADIKAENINCTGCQSDGDVLFGHCLKCEYRKCANDRQVKTCAHCSDYSCDKLSKFFEWVPSAKETLDAIRANL